MDPLDISVKPAAAAAVKATPSVLTLIYFLHVYASLHVQRRSPNSCHHLSSGILTL